jgi:hypothetical protein
MMGVPVTFASYTLYGSSSKINSLTSFPSKAFFSFAIPTSSKLSKAKLTL